MTGHPQARYYLFSNEGVRSMSTHNFRKQKASFKERHNRIDRIISNVKPPVEIQGTLRDITEQSDAQERLNTIMENTLDGLCIADRHGRVISVSDSFCKMTCYSKNELLALNFFQDLFSTPSVPPGEAIRQTISNGRKSYPSKIKTKNEKEFSAETRISFSSTLNEFTIIVRDKTDTLRIQRALNNSISRYRKLFEGAPLMYIILKSKEGKLLISDCNTQFMKALGYNRSDVIGRKISDFYTPESKRKMNRGEGVRYYTENGVSLSERELITSTGQTITAEIQAVPEYEKNGHYSGARVMYFDITNHRETEKKMQKNLKFLQGVVNGIGEPLLIIDDKYTILMMNSAAENYFNHKTESCILKKCHQVFKQSTFPCKGCSAGRVIANQTKETIERKGLMDPDLLEKVFIYPINDSDGKASSAVLRIRDITKEIQVERELAMADKMISLGILVSGVAHEINNPNNFIMLNTPILWDAWKGIIPVLEKYYNENGDFSLAGLPYSEMKTEIPLLFAGLKDGADRIRQIVDDLKGYVRQSDQLMNQDIDINTIVKSAIRLTRNTIYANTKNFHVDYGQQLPLIRGNKPKLEQVAVNLITNACQALPDINKKIIVKTFYDAEPKRVVIEVKDEGVGFRSEDRNRIMDPFFTTKRDIGGTGLGLAISSNIIKSHGGSIEASSDDKKGSVFRVSIPAKICSSKNPVKILAVDDEPDIREFIEEIFDNPEKFAVRVAVNGKEALLKIGQEVPDLLVLDINMPDMNGLELCRLLKKEPELSEIKVLIITGFFQSDLLNDINELGYTNIIPKPFKLSELKRQVTQITGVDL